jgi:hypothetical protein
LKFEGRCVYIASTAFLGYREVLMSKPRDQHKEEKKKPQKTLKEKRQMKLEKKKAKSSGFSPL